MEIPMVMARRVKFAAAIREGGGRRRSLRERRVSPHVQMMERKDRPMPDPANKNPPLAFRNTSELPPPPIPGEEESTDLAKINVTALIVDKITCVHQDNQLERRNALDAEASKGSIRRGGGGEVSPLSLSSLSS